MHEMSSTSVYYHSETRLGLMGVLAHTSSITSFINYL